MDYNLELIYNLEKINKCQRFLANEGLKETIHRLFDSALGTVYDNKTQLVYNKFLKRYGPRVPPKNKTYDLVIREASLRDVEKLYRSTYQARSELVGRLRENKVCIIGLVNSEIVSYLWLTAKQEPIPDIRCNFLTPPGNIYLFNVRTKRTWRGKGLFSHLLAWTCSELYRRSLESIYVTILADNLASKKVFEKAGFQRIGYVFYKNLLGQRKHVISPGLPISPQNP